MLVASHAMYTVFLSEMTSLTKTPSPLLSKDFSTSILCRLKKSRTSEKYLLTKVKASALEILINSFNKGKTSCYKLNYAEAFSFVLSASVSFIPVLPGS